MPRTAPSATYLPEIDGLRAIAVIAVMAYHANPRWLPGGYAGVDVFFVISGFLITRVLLADLRAGRSLWQFWDRRIRRILPPLLALIVVALTGGWLLLTPQELAGLAASAFASLYSGSNVYFWLSSGSYFDLAAPLQPLLHTWSLGVEEQFYLAYPVVLLLVVRYARRFTAVGIWVAATASFAFACYTAQHHPAAGFFLLFSRAWELLVGCGIALMPQKAERLPPTAVDTVCLLALGTLAATFVFANDGTPWPGVATAPLIAASAVLVVFAPSSSQVRRLLASRTVVGMGLISYGAYLWHHLLFAGARLVSPQYPRTTDFIALSVASIAIAAISYRAIERPVRDRQRWRPSKFYGLLAVSMSILTAASFFLWYNDGAPHRLSARMQAISAMTTRYPQAMDPCFYPPGASRPFMKSCTRGAHGAAAMAIIGDSHAMALAPGFDPVLERAGVRSRLLIAAGCPPVTDPRVMSELQAHCAAFGRSVYRWILGQEEIRVVVIAARWPFSFHHSFADNGEGGVEIGPDDGLRPDPVRDRRFAASLIANVARLLAAGKSVVLVDSVPEPGWDVPKYLVHQYLRNGKSSMPSIDALRWNLRVAPAAAMLDQVGHHPRLIRIYPADATCGKPLQDRCVLGTATWPYYFDDDHPNREGALVMIDQQLRATGDDARVVRSLQGHAR